jgi:hypothetical protein
MTTAVDEPQDERGGHRLPQQQPDGAADQGAAQQNLSAAGAEHPAPHRPQARRRQLQADHEHQEQHPEFGQHGDIFVVGKSEPAEHRPLGRHAPQAEGAEQGADREEAQYLVDAQALQGRDQDAGQAEEQQDLPQKRKGMLLHGSRPFMENDPGIV